MYISKLHIAAFGPIIDADITASPGLNIIDGVNESGKSAVAMFIKFIFYGLSGRASEEISEKQHYINWARGYASGYAVCAVGDRVYRVERTLNVKTSSDGRPKYSESVKLLDDGTSMPERLTVSPGEFFFGVPEGVFMNTAFSAQGVDARPDPAAVRESIENILSTADENVNVRRAEDILEKARVRLMHKNRTGGEIVELERERDGLVRLREETRESAAALISAEQSLSDVNARIAESAARAAELEELSDALAVVEARRRADKAEELNAELTRSREELALAVRNGADEQFISTLAVAVRDLDRAAHLRADERDDRSGSGQPASEIASDITAYRAAGRRSSRAFTISVILLILGLLGIVGCAYLSISGGRTVIPAVAASAVAAVGGIAEFIICSVRRRKQESILDRLGIDTEDDLDAAFASAEERAKAADSLREERDAAERAASLAADTIADLSRRVGLDGETSSLSAAKAAGRLGKFVKESTDRRRALEAECARLEGQLAEASAAAREASADESGILESEVGRRAAELSDDDVRRLRRERAFRTEQAEGLRRRELELERETARLRASAKSPAEVAEQLADAETRLAAKTEMYIACVKALDTLHAAGESLRSSIIPRLTENASRIMSGVTGGRYSSIGVSPTLDMSFRTENFGTRELDYLSAGTRDIAHLALRLALVGAMFDGAATPPVIFDESLAFLDEDRVREALGVLRDSGVQTFLFTCRSLEASLGGDCTVTHLPRPDGNL